MAKKKKEIIEFAIDFDGTVVEHMYPQNGPDVPNAVKVLRALSEKGHKLIINTMRDKLPLKKAQAWFEGHGIPIFGVNRNPNQYWTSSPKVYAQIYIDDAALGVPLLNYAIFKEDVTLIRESTITFVKGQKVLIVPENDTLSTLVFIPESNLYISVENSFLQFDFGRDFVNWFKVETILKTQKYL